MSPAVFCQNHLSYGMGPISESVTAATAFGTATTGAAAAEAATAKEGQQNL